MTPEAYDRMLAEIAVHDYKPGDKRRNVARCGSCGFTWDDSKATDLTPAPSARCPNEYNHEDES